MQWTPPVIWAVSGLALIALEAAVPGLVIVFFGLGALATSLALVAFDLEPSHQFILFAVVSVVFLFTLRGRFKKLFEGRSRSDTEQVARMESLLGETAVVTESAPPGGTGRVKLRGTFYLARCESALAEGDAVRVTGDPRGDHSLLVVEKQ